MTFLSLVLKNLLRQRVRTLLTVVGITVGIATVVALGAITAGMKGTADEFITAGEAQFIVAQKGAADLSFSRLDAAVLPAVAAVPGVAAVSGLQLEIMKVGSNPFFFLGGVEPSMLRSQGLSLARGRLPRGGDEVVLGTDAATDLGVDVGGSVTLGGTTLRVVGVYDTRVVWQRGGGFAPLDTVQQMVDRPGVVTLAYVTVAPGADPDAVAAAIRRKVPEVVTISGADEYGQVDQGFTLIDGASTAISVLAILIGGIGVMNTMVMAIFERTREIGVLRAVGWPAGRVLRMVMAESLVLCLVAAALGALVGVALVQLVVLVPSVRGLVVPGYPPSVFVRALVVAVAVGLLGAVYPAVRATRLTPMEA
ncbi:MAG: ABC transporter permease, partial [Actinomycetes bacterium]